MFTSLREKDDSAMVFNRKILSTIAICFVGTIASAQTVGCSGSSPPTADPMLASPDSTALVVSATPETTATTGIVQWEARTIAGGTEVNGVDANAMSITQLTMRAVDNQDGNGVVVELSTDGHLARIASDGRLLFNEMSPALFQHLGRDVNRFQAENHGAYAASLACILATAAAVAAGVAVAFTCVPPIVVTVGPCAGAIALYLGALAVEADMCKPKTCGASVGTCDGG